MASGVTAHNNSAFQQNDLHTGTQNEQVKTVPSGQHLAEAWLATPLGLNSRLFSANCSLSERLLALPTRQCKGPSRPRSTLSVAPLLWSPQPRIQSVWSCALVFDPIMPHAAHSTTLLSTKTQHVVTGREMEDVRIRAVVAHAQSREREICQAGSGSSSLGEEHIEGWSPCIRTGRVLGTRRDGGGAFIGVQALLSYSPPAPETSCNSFSETPHPSYLHLNRLSFLCTLDTSIPGRGTDGGRRKKLGIKRTFVCSLILSLHKPH